MGSSDSKDTNNQEQQNKQKENGKQVRFKPQVDDGDHQNIPYTNNKKIGQPIVKKAINSANKSKLQQIQKIIQQPQQKININQFLFSSQAPQKQSKQKLIKVKKTYELRNKAQREKVKKQILEVNRLQLTTQIPTLPRNGTTFEKPVIEYSPRKKVGLLPSQSQKKYISKWNVPIASSRDPNQRLFTNNESYMSVNESVKSPFKQKQIEMRLDDIRNGRFLESISGRMQKVFQYDQLESNQSSYM